MSGVLRVFDTDSADEETRRLSRLAQGCWSPLTIVYDPLKAGSIDSTDTVPHDKAIVRAQNADFAPNKRIKGKPECTVFIGNLNPTTTNRSLGDEFSRYGRVVKATVVQDIITGRSRGYGFVEYSLEGEAAKAYEYAHRAWLDGNKITVDMECGRLLPGWVPRRLGGGFNGRKESGQLRFGCRERPFRKPIKLLTEKEIKTVFEKTMGRTLSDRVKGNVEPDRLADESSEIAESVTGDGTFESNSRIGVRGVESRRHSKDYRKDERKRSRKHSSDREGSKLEEGSSKRDRDSRKRDRDSRKREERGSKSRKHDGERRGRVSPSEDQETRRKRDQDTDEHYTKSDETVRERESKRDQRSTKHKKKKKSRSRSRSLSTPEGPELEHHDH